MKSRECGIVKECVNEGRKYKGDKESQGCLYNCIFDQLLEQISANGANISKIFKYLEQQKYNQLIRKLPKYFKDWNKDYSQRLLALIRCQSL